MPALAPETSYRVEPAGNEFTDEQFWQAEVGLDKSNDAVDAELKEETVDEGVAEPDAPLEEPDALDVLDVLDVLGDADADDTDPPCGTTIGSRAAISWNFWPCFLALFLEFFPFLDCGSNTKTDESDAYVLDKITALVRLVAAAGCT